MRWFLFVIGACTSLHGATGRDKVHPPCTRLMPFIPPAAPCRPQSLANDCAPTGAPGVATPIRSSAPRRTGDPPRRRLIPIQAAQSMGQTAGVSGVFPMPACATHWLTSRLQPLGTPTKVVSLGASLCPAHRAPGPGPSHHGFERVVCGGFGVVVGVSLAPLVFPFRLLASSTG